MWDVKLDIRKYGDALIVKFWIDGEPGYGVFASIEGVKAWVADNRLALDASDTVWLKVA